MMMIWKLVLWSSENKIHNLGLYFKSDPILQYNNLALFHVSYEHLLVVIEGYYIRLAKKQTFGCQTL